MRHFEAAEVNVVDRDVSRRSGTFLPRDQGRRGPHEAVWSAKPGVAYDGRRLAQEA
jgi:hypothetical protein